MKKNTKIILGILGGIAVITTIFLFVKKQKANATVATDKLFKMLVQASTVLGLSINSSDETKQKFLALYNSLTLKEQEVVVAYLTSITNFIIANPNTNSVETQAQLVKYVMENNAKYGESVSASAMSKLKDFIKTL